MMDREQTIKEMTVLRNWLLHMAEFNSHGNGDMYDHDGYVVASALELLKRQEAKPVQNIGQQISCKSGLCPTCGKMLNTTCNKKFCGDCGQELTWE